MSGTETQCSVHALDHLVLTVSDINATVRFYTRLLGMRAEQFDAADGTRRHALSFGHQKINLHQKGQEFEPKAALAGTGTADLCFLTNDPLSDWVSRCAEQSVVIEEGPVARSGATGPIVSIYVRDPDGNLIEVSVQAPQRTAADFNASISAARSLE